MKKIWVIGGLGGLAVVAGALVFGSAGASGAIEYTNPARIAEGRVVYDEACASCHGEQLEGQEDWHTRNEDGRLPAPPHDHSGHTWHHPGAQLFEITKFGTEALVGGDYKSDMRGFGEELTDAQIWAVLSYIKSTWPAQVIEAHNKVEAQN